METMTKQSVSVLFNTVSECSLFRIGGNDVDILQTIALLVDAIIEEDETDWSTGEGGEFTLDTLLVAAYWALTDCHSGQYSNTYACMCKIGDVFSPGMSSIESECDGTRWLYDVLCNHFLALN